MTPDPAIVKSVENLGYRVTVGDVAAQAGLEVNLAQRGLLTLASDAGGHLQVTDTGEIIYLFPQNFRSILRNKFWQLRLKEWWERIWGILFYLIRISFGIILIASIVIMAIAVTILIIAITSSRDGDSDSSSSRSSSDGGGIFLFPYFWSSDIWWWMFDPSYRHNRYRRQPQTSYRSVDRDNKMNFLEAIFSFLFGDGNPNIDLEEKRWQEIGNTIRQNQGSVIAQQLAPYLDNIDDYNRENEDYILPVLARFNGYPQVSPQGEMIYYFPELQVTAQKRNFANLSNYLKEKLWKFSEAGSGQIGMAIGLGIANVVLVIVLGGLLQQGEIVQQIGGFILFVQSIYWVLLGYAVGFLSIPVVRYFWIRWKNSRIQSRNQNREKRAEQLATTDDDRLRQKLAYAREFAKETIVTQQDIAYSTDRDLLEQESDRSDDIDREWRRRLESS